MKINKFNQFKIFENSKFDEITHDFIDDFFSDYIDNDLGEISVRDCLIIKKSDYEYVEFNTTYVKDIKNTSKGKLVKLKINSKDDKGISIDGRYSLRDISVVKDISETIERFYKWLDLEPSDINYTINTGFDGLGITFIIKGDQFPDSESIKDKIDSHLDKILKMVKSRYNYRGISLKGNWLDIMFPKSNKDGDYFWKVTFNKFLRGGMTPEQIESLRTRSNFHKELLDWVDAVNRDGLTVNIGGGDNQVVISLKRQ